MPWSRSPERSRVRSWPMVSDALQSAIADTYAAARRPGHAIYAVDLWLKDLVHAGCVGFTRYLPCRWVIAASAPGAARRATAHYTSLGASVLKADARLALQQDIRAYVFPEQILLPD